MLTGSPVRRRTTRGGTTSLSQLAVWSASPWKEDRQMEDHSSLTRHQLLSCLELGKILTAELDAARLLDTILTAVSTLLPAERWSLLLLDETAGELWFALSVDLEPTLTHGLRLRLGEGIAGQVALQQQPMMVADVQTSPFFATRVDQMTGFRTSSILCAPLLFG